MRQAGRSLPEYRAVRGEGSILDAIKQPELAAAITLQPVRRYGVDAAVLYSDIVVPPHAVGFGIDVAPGTGPGGARAAAPPRRPRPPAPAAARRHRLRRRDRRPGRAPSSGPTCPVLAFAGAPFTVASYLIEGGPSRTYEHTKALLHTDEALWHDVMDRLAAMAVEFIDVQLDERRPGVPAVRLVGRRAVAAPTTSASCCPTRGGCSPSSPRATPTRRASTSASAATTSWRRCTRPARGSSGLDWRTPIAAARARLGADLVVQGNLDPALVLAGAEPALAGAARRARRQRRPSRPHLQPRPRRPPDDRPRRAGGDRRPRPRATTASR